MTALTAVMVAIRDFGHATEIAPRGMLRAANSALAAALLVSAAVAAGTRP